MSGEISKFLYLLKKKVFEYVSKPAQRCEILIFFLRKKKTLKIITHGHLQVTAKISKSLES